MSKTRSLGQPAPPERISTGEDQEEDRRFQPSEELTKEVIDAIRAHLGAKSPDIVVLSLFAYDLIYRAWVTKKYSPAFDDALRAKIEAEGRPFVARMEGGRAKFPPVKRRRLKTEDDAARGYLSKKRGLPRAEAKAVVLQKASEIEKALVG